MDLFYEEPDGTLTVVDFKTDRIRAGDEQARAAEYATQITAYSRVLSRIFEQRVGRRILYFFATGTAVEVAEEDA